MHYIVNGFAIIKTFNTEVGAKIALKRKYLAKYPMAKVVSEVEFRASEPMVETRNLMNPSAGPIMIRASEKGGCTDPGTERYWAM